MPGLALALLLQAAPLFHGAANPPRGAKVSFPLIGLVPGQRYRLETAGECKAPRRLRPRLVNRGRDRPEPFGTEYRVFIGRLEFSVDTEPRSQPFRADEGVHTVVVENRSSDVVTGVSCSLTSITIVPDEP